MTELKRGWRRVKFGEVVRQVKDKVEPEASGLERFIAGEHMDTDDLRIRRWGDIGNGYLGPAFHMHFRPGHVLYGSRRTYLRKVAVPDFEGICANTTFVLESADPKVLLPELLPFIMQTEAFHEHSKRESKGSVNPYVNFSDLAWYEFALPPLEKQRRMFEVLLAAEATIQSLFETAEPLEATTRRLLEAFDLPNLPYAAVIDLLSEPPKNGVSPSCNADGRGRPTLSVGCVYSGVVNTETELKYADVEADTFERFRLHADDILVVRGNGNRALVGRAGIVEDPSSKCFFPDLLIRLRFNTRRIDPHVAVLLWNTVSIHADLVRRAKSTNGIYKINGVDIRAHQLPVPTRQQQEAMLDAAAIHLRSKRTLDERLAAAKSIKSALLDSLASNHT